MRAFQPVPDLQDDAAALRQQVAALEQAVQQLAQELQETQLTVDRLRAQSDVHETRLNAVDAKLAAVDQRGLETDVNLSEVTAAIQIFASKLNVAEEVREAMMKAGLEEKSKSMVGLEVKAVDALPAADLEQMQKNVLAIEIDGLLWGTAKWVELAHGARKLEITCVVDEGKMDALKEAIVVFAEP